MENESPFIIPDARILEVETLAPPTVTFSQDNKDIGTLSWEGGKFHFEGDAEESAKVFFDFLRPYIDNYIESENKRRIS